MGYETNINIYKQKTPRMWAHLLLIGVLGLFRFSGLAIRLSFSIWFKRVDKGVYAIAY